MDGTVLVQTRSDVGETIDFLGMADANRDLILGVVGWVDLTDPAIAQTLASLRAGPGGDRLVGIRHQVQGEADPDWRPAPTCSAALPRSRPQASSTICWSSPTSSTP